MVKKLAFSPDGKKIIHSSKQETFVWSLDSKSLVYKCSGSLFAISNDSQTFLTRDDNTFQAWDNNTNTKLSLEEVNPDTYGRYERSLILADRKSKAFIIQDVLSIHPPVEIYFGDGMDSLDQWIISPDGKLIAIALYFSEHHPLLAVNRSSGWISIYHLSNGKPIQRVGYQNSGGDFIRIGPQRSRTIAVHRSRDSFQIKQHKVRNGIITEPEAVLDVAFHPNGQFIAAILSLTSLCQIQAQVQVV